MNRFENVLVAVDLNRRETEHLEVAAELAQRTHATLSLAYILPDNNLHQNLDEVLAKQASAGLEELRTQLTERGIKKVSVHLQRGEIVQSLIQIAKSTDADVIVLFEKHADTKHLVSSLVKKVIRVSPIPVWTVLKGAKKAIKKILCPVDGSPASKEALSVALDIARLYEARVHALYVYEPITHVPTLVKVNLEEVNREGFALAKQQFAAFLQVFDSKMLSNELLQGEAKAKILESLADYDLLVMGTTGRTGISRFVMGSVTEAVISNATCSFVTTHAQTLLPERLEEELSQIEFHFKAGLVLLNANKPKEAIKELAECLRLDPFYVPAMLKLAEAHEHLGDAHQAKQHRRQAENILERLWGKTLTDEIVKDFTSR